MICSAGSVGGGACGSSGFAAAMCSLILHTMVGPDNGVDYDLFCRKWWWRSLWLRWIHCSDMQSHTSTRGGARFTPDKRLSYDLFCRKCWWRSLWQQWIRCSDTQSRRASLLCWAACRPLSAARLSARSALGGRCFCRCPHPSSCSPGGGITPFYPISGGFLFHPLRIFGVTFRFTSGQLTPMCCSPGGFTFSISLQGFVHSISASPFRMLVLGSWVPGGQLASMCCSRCFLCIAPTRYL